MIKKISRILKIVCKDIVSMMGKTIIDGWFGSIWEYRAYIRQHRTKLGVFLYYSYWKKYGAWIGLEATIDGIPKCPHEYHGIFISNMAYIGKNVTILQQVTIGSVLTIGSKHWGAPTIGDNVLIGAGARIVGGVKIGSNSRIGAGCVVACDIPENSVVYQDGLQVVTKTEPMDNSFVYINPNVKV